MNAKRGRPTEHPEGAATCYLNARVPPAIMQRLDGWAEKNGLNRSQAVTELIRRLRVRRTTS